MIRRNQRTQVELQAETIKQNDHLRGKKALPTKISATVMFQAGIKRP